MSHILEEYSKCLGVKSRKPILEPHFFPITAERYITVETAPESFSSLVYPYWKNVVSLIKDYDPSIVFIDITHGKEKIDDCFDTSIKGQCSYRHLCYIISKAKAHISVDSYTGHIAALFNIPAVTLFSHLPSNVSKPLWHEDEDLHDSIRGLKDGIKPCYSKVDPENLINLIKPEEIAKSILSKINIKNDLASYNTINIGKYYKDEILEVVPDFDPSEFIQSKLINLRCDYEFNLDLIKKWLRFKLNLMIDQPIPIDIILQNRNNIAGVTVFIKDKSITPSYINQLSQARIKFGLVCPNKDIISDVRLKFFESDVEEYNISDKKDLDFHEDICDNSFYHSNKTLISKNKKYKSKAHWLNSSSIKDDNLIIDCPDFWEEVEHFNIYNHAKKKN
jgi:hypothetical protein